MKIKLKKKPLCLMPFIFLLYINEKTTIPRTDFSGIWIIDYSKSEFGQAPHFTAAKQIMVKEKDNVIDIERIQDSRISNNPDTTVIEKLTFDGLVYKNITSTHQQKSSKLIWSDDGQNFKILTKLSLPDNPDKEKYRQLEHWTLTEAGKKMIIDKTVETNTGFKYTVKAVYDKK
jgi:hypothetical protein